MTDAEIRALVREAVARHLGPAAAPPAPAAVPSPSAATLPSRTHPSFARFLVLATGESDDACLIEPSVRCTHCGYCQSYGH